MKKKLTTILCTAIVVLALYIGIETGVFYNECELSNTLIDNKTEIILLNDDIAEVPISDVEAVAKQKRDGITQEEAERLCRDVLGEKAEETGFSISYRCIGAVSTKNKLYYVMHISWLVDDNHWSYIGNCYVSSDGKEIYDGVVVDEKYEITELRWKQ